jgi:hypothetical protein
MAARTVAVRHAVVQAGERGLIHIASQQDTGTWVARCGRQVRGRTIDVHEGLAGILHAEKHEDAMCPDCLGLALAVAAAIDFATAR